MGGGWLESLSWGLMEGKINHIFSDFRELEFCTHYLTVYWLLFSVSSRLDRGMLQMNMMAKSES